MFQENRIDIFCCITAKSTREASKQLLRHFFEKYYTPFVLHAGVRPIVIFSFMAWLIGSILVLPGIEIGLEQDLAMPKDSYLKKYFQVNQFSLLRAQMYPSKIFFKLTSKFFRILREEI